MPPWWTMLLPKALTHRAFPLLQTSRHKAVTAQGENPQGEPKERACKQGQQQNKSSRASRHPSGVNIDIQASAPCVSQHRAESSWGRRAGACLLLPGVVWVPAQPCWDPQYRPSSLVSVGGGQGVPCKRHPLKSGLQGMKLWTSWH